jgi:cellulose synthase/poly-beta-1,6-N-acetylglucosamine synthase-like glycosyltransferase
MEREAADVVVPVAGSADDVRAVLARMRALRLGPGDSLTVVDNRGTGVDEPEVLVATRMRTSYHARNAGALRGTAPWLVFLDADVEAPADLLDRLLSPPPGARVGVIAGAVIDEPAAADAPPAIRYAWLKHAMSQETTLAHGRWAFAQTAHCAVRREAFEAAGGFREEVRSGGDADLCWRLGAAGWELRSAPGAAVVHRNRSSVPALLRQRARHGSGVAWLGREHPGALPSRASPGLVWWAVRRFATGVWGGLRGDRDALVLGVLDGPAVWAFELGRLVPNRPCQLRRRR